MAKPRKAKGELKVKEFTTEGGIKLVVVEFSDDEDLSQVGEEAEEEEEEE